MEIQPIGKIKSTVTNQTDKGWGNVVSEIYLDQHFVAGLKGIETFSHAIIVFYMDRSTFSMDSDLVRRPQGRSDMPEVGIFAQRAKHRPNPIGITAVKIEGITNNVLTVKGLDAIDETPVLDIKPYYPQYDLVRNVSVPEWVNRLMEKYF